MIRLAFGCVALLVLSAMAFLRSPSDGAAAAQASAVAPRWDESSVYLALTARLENCATVTPDVKQVIDLMRRVCQSAEPPLAAPRQEGDWQMWDVEPRPGQRVKVSFGRGVDQGRPATRVTISLLPTAAVPSPFQTQGSLIDLRALNDGDATEIVGVVAYGVNFYALPFDDGEMPPPLTFGHRFRLADAGKVHLMRYFSKLSHENNRHVLVNCYGSDIWEVEAPYSLRAGTARDLAALISSRVPVHS